MTVPRILLAGAALAAPAALLPPAAHAADPGWQACSAQAEPAARLACYDAWARAQPAPAVPAAAAPGPAPAPDASAAQATPPPAPAWSAPPASAKADDVRLPEPPPLPPPAPPGTPATLEPRPDGLATSGCGSATSPLARFWDLETASGCGVFGIRLYRPLSLSLITADKVNQAPTSDNPSNVVPPQPYRVSETRIQLSVRTKLAEGLLTERGPLRDSLWFAYTQQSYWQLFTPALSRPFRSTDHEPEIIYVHPLSLRPVAGWTPRLVGLGLVHQSNGQSLPRSRSWNRVYAMAGIDHASGASLQLRAWKRLREDRADDDNPGIQDFIGRAELTAGWVRPHGQSATLTWRSTLKDVNRGSWRVDWYVPVSTADAPGRFGRLRLHTQLFSGYGDSLLDYNVRRTVLAVGLSLVDW